MEQYRCNAFVGVITTSRLTPLDANIPFDQLDQCHRLVVRHAVIHAVNHLQYRRGGCHARLPCTVVLQPWRVSMCRARAARSWRNSSSIIGTRTLTVCCQSSGLPLGSTRHCNSHLCRTSVYSAVEELPGSLHGFGLGPPPMNARPRLRAESAPAWECYTVNDGPPIHGLTC